eukprot:scaffold927_cov230-Pinguiococcus_pyrenoidosus.AAC.4
MLSWGTSLYGCFAPSRTYADGDRGSSSSSLVTHFTMKGMRHPKTTVVNRTITMVTFSISCWFLSSTCRTAETRVMLPPNPANIALALAVPFGLAQRQRPRAPARWSR